MCDGNNKINVELIYEKWWKQGDKWGRNNKVSVVEITTVKSIEKITSQVW